MLAQELRNVPRRFLLIWLRVRLRPRRSCRLLRRRAWVQWLVVTLVTAPIVTVCLNLVVGRLSPIIVRWFGGQLLHRAILLYYFLPFFLAISQIVLDLPS